MRIGELARATGETVKTIRYWSDLGLLDATRDPGSGYRRYGAHATERVRFLRSAQRLGLALADVKELLRARDVGSAPPCKEALALLRDRRDEVRRRIASLRALDRELTARLTRAATTTTVPCDRDCVHLVDAPSALAEGSRLPPSRTPAR